MLDSHSKPTPMFPGAMGRTPAANGLVPPPLGGVASDAVMDAALCRLPLPEGLLSRLYTMLATMDEIGDPKN